MDKKELYSLEALTKLLMVVAMVCIIAGWVVLAYLLLS